MDTRSAIDWDRASWLNPPPHVATDGSDLLVTAEEGSDFWRTTGYGFVRDSGHALLTAMPAGSSVEVTFRADFDALYDQAGLMVRADAHTWIKAGVEMTDGVPHLGAVVTRNESDWSMAPVPDWDRRLVTVRASRDGDALTVRARCEDGPWRMLRLAPLAPGATTAAGPYCCSPQRDGLVVRFTRFVTGPADTSLHDPVEP